jgi:hypothetical protein
VAHSPIIITGHADGSRHVQGILNITPNDPQKVGELVGLRELHSRVDESAALARDLLKMQEVFRSEPAPEPFVPPDLLQRASPASAGG